MRSKIERSPRKMIDVESIYQNESSEEPQPKPIISSFKSSKIELFQEASNYKTMSQVLISLEENFCPEDIQCRNQEKKAILSYLQEGIQNKGSPQSLYVSGVPGIGKTLCVREVVNKLKEENRASCKMIYVNAMSLTCERDIFKALLFELCKQRYDSAQAMYILNEFFVSGIAHIPALQSMVKMNKILVIDEIDFLNNKKQDVIYNIFEWTQKHHSRLTIISISNTMDFPDHLSGKICSRMGSKRLTFPHYKSHQINTILNQRIGGNSIFDDKAIAYISKKIAQNCSDIRKCLYVLRQAISEHLAIEKKKHKKDQLEKIPVSVLARIHQEIYSDSFTDGFEYFPLGYKVVLNQLARYNKSEMKACSYRQLEALCSKHFKQAGQLHVVLCDLRDLGIIKIKITHVTRDNRSNTGFTNMMYLSEQYITLCVDYDRILVALSKEDKNQLFNFADL